MTILKSRLYEAELRNARLLSRPWKTTRAISPGVIRSALTCWTSPVKDLRTNVETGNTTAVLDGALESFIGASLKQGV